MRGRSATRNHLAATRNRILYDVRGRWHADEDVTVDMNLVNSLRSLKPLDALGLLENKV